MQKLADDPAFWLAVSAFLGFAYTWAKTKTAELEARTAQLEARSAQGTAQTVAEGQGIQQATLVQHGEAIAALQATNPSLATPALPAPPAPGVTVPPVAAVSSVPVDSSAGPSLGPPASSLP